jgi:hypothetical protein
MDEWNPLTEKREWHPATSEDGCDAIEARLQKMGYRVELIEAFNTGKGELRYACIFEGPDADPHAERFKSYQEVDS